MKRTRIVAVALAGCFLAFTANEAAAQQLNPRKKAPPKAESGVQRVVARAELQAKQKQGSSLRSEELTVSKSCGQVQIGGTPADADQQRPTTLRNTQSLRNQENTTVAKNVVNICR